MRKYNIATGLASLRRLPGRLHNSIKKRTRPASGYEDRYEIMDLMARRIKTLEREIAELKDEKFSKSSSKLRVKCWFYQ